MAKFRIFLFFFSLFFSGGSFSPPGGSPEWVKSERHENGFGARQGRDGATPRFDYEESGGGGGGVAGRFGGEPSRSSGRPPGQRFGGQSGPPVQSRSSRGVVEPTDGPQEGAVLMVYGLNMEKMNADRLFNLLCLYGNVFKVNLFFSSLSASDDQGRWPYLFIYTYLNDVPIWL